MWPPWSRSPVRILSRHGSKSKTTTTTLNHHTTASSNFAFSSFKDIEAICSEEANPAPSSLILRQRLPSVCHRVRATSNILRSCSTPGSIFLDVFPESEASFNQPPPLKPHISDLSERSKLDRTHVPKPQSQIPNAFEFSEKKHLESERNQLEKSQSQEPPPISLPGAETRIVIYYTSLRIVRPTFEACKAALTILQGFRVPIDERDLSMDASFLTELKQILNDGSLLLPRVFIGGRYVGGFEEVRQLHECGELKKMVEGLPVMEPGVCEGCGGFRFVLCGECCGSRKVYFEKGGFRSCAGCNENGVVRCPNCSFQSPLVS